MYALAAQRHMYEFGTTSEQLAWVKVAASEHAQYNQHALLRKPVTVEDVVNSPMLSDPLHRLDCCVVTDGGGAVIVASPEVARQINRPKVKILGHGEAPKHTNNGHIDLTYTGARVVGPRAFDEAGVTPSDIEYASIYDSFTITVVETIEDLGFCEKGKGGQFVADGGLRARGGKLPVNTDGGGLCNNHPGMGGMMKILEGVRQVRGEAHPRCRCRRLATWRWCTARAARSARAWPAHADSWDGGRMTSCSGKDVTGAGAGRAARGQGVLGWHGRGQAAAAALHRVSPAVIWYPRPFCPACASTSVTWVPSVGPRHDLQLHGQPPRRGRPAGVPRRWRVRAGVRRAGRGAADHDEHRRVRPGSGARSGRRWRSCSTTRARGRRSGGSAPPASVQRRVISSSRPSGRRRYTGARTGFPSSGRALSFLVAAAAVRTFSAWSLIGGAGYRSRAGT